MKNPMAPKGTYTALENHAKKKKKKKMVCFRRFWVDRFRAPNPSLYYFQVILSPKRVSSCEGVKVLCRSETISDEK